jgi:cell division protein FtsZ
VNVDFADVRTVMTESGNAIMGSASAEGENRALVAVENALASPLLDDNDIRGARYVLLYITFGNNEVLMDEISEITDYIQEESGHTADVIFGTGYDESLGDKVCVTVIATGFESKGSRPVHTEPAKMVLEIENPNPSFILPPDNLSEPVFTEKTITPDTNGILNTERVSEPVHSEIEKISLDLNPVDNSDFSAQNKETEPTASLEVSEQSSLVSDINNKFELPASAMADEPIVSEVAKVSSDIIPPYMHKDDDTISPEELFKQKERMVRLKEISHKLKNPSGLKELESQPAYERRNVRLDSLAASDKDQISSMAVSPNDPNGQVIVRQNSFLHGNVD